MMSSDFWLPPITVLGNCAMYLYVFFLVTGNPISDYTFLLTTAPWRQSCWINCRILNFWSVDFWLTPINALENCAMYLYLPETLHAVTLFLLQRWSIDGAELVAGLWICGWLLTLSWGNVFFMLHFTFTRNTKWVTLLYWLQRWRLRHCWISGQIVNF